MEGHTVVPPASWTGSGSGGCLNVCGWLSFRHFRRCGGLGEEVSLAITGGRARSFYALFTLSVKPQNMLTRLSFNSWNVLLFKKCVKANEKTNKRPPLLSFQTLFSFLRCVCLPLAATDGSSAAFLKVTWFRGKGAPWAYSSSECCSHRRGVHRNTRSAARRTAQETTKNR